MKKYFSEILYLLGDEKNKLKILFIGAGNIAKQHLIVLEKLLIAFLTPPKLPAFKLPYEEN